MGLPQFDIRKYAYLTQGTNRLQRANGVTKADSAPVFA